MVFLEQDDPAPLPCDEGRHRRPCGAAADDQDVAIVNNVHRKGWRGEVRADASFALCAATGSCCDFRYWSIASRSKVRSLATRIR